MRSNSSCGQEGKQYFIQCHETENRWDEAERENETMTKPQRKIPLSLRMLEKFEAWAEVIDVQERKRDLKSC